MYAVNKVVYGNRILIDLTADTVTPDSLLAGRTAHKADGSVVTGTLFNGCPASCEVWMPLQDASENEIGDSTGSIISGRALYERV